MIREVHKIFIVTFLALAVLSSVSSVESSTSLAMQGEETLINIDVKDADVRDVLRLLAEVGGFNLAADPDVQCQATLKLTAVPWPQVLELVLKTCRLGQDRLGENLVRVAKMESIREELAARRKYEEEKAMAGELKTSYRQLSYARAQELAPILEKFLSPRGSIAFDERTNTLIITDVQ